MKILKFEALGDDAVLINGDLFTRAQMPLVRFCPVCLQSDEIVSKDGDEKFHQRLGCGRCDIWFERPRLK